MNILKTMGTAVFFAAVTAISVVWYIDYKIDQATEAVMAPVYATTEKVNETIGFVEGHVSTASDVVGGIADVASSEMSDRHATVRADLQYEWENAKELADAAGSWFDSLRS